MLAMHDLDLLTLLEQPITVCDQFDRFRQYVTALQSETEQKQPRHDIGWIQDIIPQGNYESLFCSCFVIARLRLDAAKLE